MKRSLEGGKTYTTLQVDKSKLCLREEKTFFSLHSRSKFKQVSNFLTVGVRFT